MRYFFLIFVILATPLQAEPLRVVTTIAPLYGIVSDLMRGVGQPVLIVTKGTDPHHFSLKPSQIFALNDADIIFAVGGNMEPWLARILPGIEGEVVYLSEVLVLRDHRLPLRELDDIGDHNHAHTTDSFDPHMWLDPELGRAWVLQAALTLSKINPQNNEIYHANAQAIIRAIDASLPRLQQSADHLSDHQIIASHDSLQYLEMRFNLNIVGAFSSGSGDHAGARSLSRLTHLEGAVCLLTDTSENTADYANLFPDWPLVGFDPLGHDLAGQPEYLGNLYLSLAAALENCITDP